MPAAHELDPPLHREIFYWVYSQLKKKGKLVSPRGQKVLEVENFSFDLPPYVRFPNFACRKLSLDYVKTEFLWYLKGDRHDLSICDHAKIWKGIVNSDGSLNSNYGQYIFGDGNQFAQVIDVLSKDKDSRRASMVILSQEHVMSKTNDLPCTYSLGFRIRDDELNMTVRMRSQDAWFGLAGDLPTFSFIHEMVLNDLRRTYPNLRHGMYHHSVDSFHIYERHFDKLDELLAGSDYEIVDCPMITGGDEVDVLRSLPFMNDFTDLDVLKFPFVHWLLSRKT